MTHIVAVCGRQNSGKTTWICALVASLADHGLRVGTVKHAHHDYAVAGKDSTRHQLAGAARVLLVSPGGSARYDTWDREPDLEDLVRDHFDGFDLVLAEGYRDRPDVPKLIVGVDPDANPNRVLGNLPPVDGDLDPAALLQATGTVLEHLRRHGALLAPR